MGLFEKPFDLTPKLSRALPDETRRIKFDSAKESLMRSSPSL